MLSVWEAAFNSDQASFGFVYHYNQPLRTAGSRQILFVGGSSANPEHWGIAKIHRLIPWTAAGTARVDQSAPVPARIETTPLLIVDAIVQSDFGIDMS